jgi:hypothetical protein
MQSKKQPGVMWKAGGVFGAMDNGHNIGILRGTGEIVDDVGGVHITGDVTADGKGGFLYSNVTNGTTTSEYWDGVSMWKAGAIIGITDKGKSIGVLSGTHKLD